LLCARLLWARLLWARLLWARAGLGRVPASSVPAGQVTVPERGPGLAPLEFLLLELLTEELGRRARERAFLGEAC
jgi:hypothetical protein